MPISYPSGSGAASGTVTSLAGYYNFIGGALLNISGKTERVSSMGATFLLIAGAVALGISMSLTCVDVILRYLFKMPIPGAYHLNEFLLVAIVALPLAYCQQTKAHIRVDLVIGRIRRVPRAVMETLTTLSALLLFSLATWKGAEEAWRAFRVGDYVEALINYPLWPSKCFLFIGTGCLCLILIIDVVHYARDMFRTAHVAE